MSSGLEIVRNCSVCGESAYKIWYQPRHSRGPIVQCALCGFVYVSRLQSSKAIIEDGPVLDGGAEDLLTSSDVTVIKGTPEETLIEQYKNEIDAKTANAQDALRRLSPFALTRGKILDIGCFCGIFLNSARSDGWEPYGLEPLVMPAIYARGFFGLDVKTDTLKNGLYPTNFFDAITAFQVFEHLLHPEVEIKKIREILKPGGALLIEVPNIETLSVKIFGAKHRHYVHDHISFFSPKTTSLLLTQFGFKVRSVYYPARVLSIGYLIWWMSKFNKKFEVLRRIIPKTLHAKMLRINSGDIFAVIAEKI